MEKEIKHIWVVDEIFRSDHNHTHSYYSTESKARTYIEYLKSCVENNSGKLVYSNDTITKYDNVYGNSVYIILHKEVIDGNDLMIGEA